MSPPSSGPHPGRPSDHLGSSPLTPGPLHEVASTVAALLDEARQAFDYDLDRTRACIARVQALMSRPLAQEPVPVLAEAARAVSTGDYLVGGMAPWQVRRVVDHIDTHLVTDLSNETLADLVQLSRSHFCAAFRRSMGVSPRAFVIARRIAHAERLMLGSGLPLAQIADACGFSDQAHFSRLFRRARGETPSRWRRLRRTVA